MQPVNTGLAILPEGALKNLINFVACYLASHQNPVGRVLHVSLIWFAQPDFIFEQPTPKGWVALFYIESSLAWQTLLTPNRPAILLGPPI
jgi:hypothetical protein